MWRRRSCRSGADRDATHHPALNLRADDYALKSPTQLYGDPHDVALVLRDGSNRQLALARSVEPQGYILAIDPDAAIGNCEQFNRGRQTEFARCYEQYSKWSATWAPLVRSADVTVGSCALRGVPVAAERSNDEWLLWWVPLRHVGGLPRAYFDLRSRSTAASV